MCKLVNFTILKGYVISLSKFLAGIFFLYVYSPVIFPGIFPPTIFLCVITFLGTKSFQTLLVDRLKGVHTAKSTVHLAQSEEITGGRLPVGRGFTGGKTQGVDYRGEITGSGLPRGNHREYITERKSPGVNHR